MPLPVTPPSSGSKNWNVLTPAQSQELNGELGRRQMYDLTRAIEGQGEGFIAGGKLVVELGVADGV